MTVEQSVEIREARLIIRWAAGALNPTEKAALLAWLTDVPERDVATQQGVTRGGIWMARRSALRKMRRRLTVLGIRGSSDVLSRAVQ